MYPVAIFDLNGTIIDDEWLWSEAFQSVAQAERVDGHVTNEPGMGLFDNWKQIVVDSGAAQYLADKTLEEYQASLSKVDGFRKGYSEFIHFLRRRSITHALATSSSQVILEKINAHFPTLLEYFDVVVTGDEVERRKPAPDIFLKALEKINQFEHNRSFGIEDCVVFEDSNAGIRAAKAAGMFVVHLPNGIEPTNESVSPDLVATDFTDERLRELFEGGDM